MRTTPIKKKSDNSDKNLEVRTRNITRMIAIAFVVIIQLAIIFKMLI